IVNFFALPRPHKIRDEPANFLRREKFACALALTLGELAQQIFVGAAQKIRLNIVKTEPIARIGQLFDDAAQSLIADFAFAAARFVKVNNVDHAAKRRIRFHDCADRRGELFPERFRFLVFGPMELFATTHDRPARLRRNVEPNQRMIRLQNFKCCFPVAVRLVQSRYLIFENVGETFDEDQWQNVVFKFGRVFFAANPARRVPEHLLHGFCRKHRALRSPALSAPRRLYFFVSQSEVALANLFQQSVERYPGRPLRFCPPVLPAIDSRKGNIKSLCKLLLTKAESIPQVANQPRRIYRHSSSMLYQICHVKDLTSARTLLAFGHNQVRFLVVPAIAKPKIQRRRVALREQFPEPCLIMLLEQLNRPEINAKQTQPPFVGRKVRHWNSRIILHNACAVSQEKIANGGKTALEHQIGGGFKKTRAATEAFAKSQEPWVGLDSAIGDVSAEIIESLLIARRIIDITNPHSGNAACLPAGSGLFKHA